jgi:putative ABC transport system substrate-binding protein
MRRREFITLLGGTAIAWPLVAHAQQASIPVIGYLSVGAPDERAHLISAFHQGLSEVGVVAGRNADIEYRWAGVQFDRLPELARELVGRKVAVILAGSDYAALAAKATTTSTPIIFAIGSDPINIGLVDRLNRPGGNMTGATWISNELQSKRLEILRELIPSGQIAILRNPKDPDGDYATGRLQMAASKIGQQLLAFNASNDAELDEAIANIAKSGASALLVVNGPFFNSLRRLLVDTVARYRIPAMYDLRAFVEAGGLLNYGASQPDAFRQAGIYVGRVLKGEKPADLPVQQPTKFELVINLKTAKALGLTVPPTLIARADEVIE